MLQISGSSLYRTMFLCVSCLLFLLDKVSADVCTTTEYCDDLGFDHGQACCPRYNEYCCSSGCCYDYGSNVWNIWYFWFIIFFILMSCCGGCGFYRRRQVVLRQHQADDLAAGPPPGAILNHGRPTYSATTMGHTIVAHPVMYPQAPPPQSYFSGPPSYNEVTSKPEMYPKAYPESHANGAPVPYPTNGYPPPGSPMPYPMNNTAIPPHTGPGAPLLTDNGTIPPPPPYTPVASSEGVPINITSQQAAS